MNEDVFELTKEEKEDIEKIFAGKTLNVQQLIAVAFATGFVNAKCNKEEDEKAVEHTSRFLEILTQKTEEFINQK